MQAPGRAGWRATKASSAFSRTPITRCHNPSLLQSRASHTQTAMELPRSFPLRIAGGKTIDVPTVGYGTWASDGTSPTTPAHPSWIKPALKIAFDAGYRHLECAWFYGVDREIGEFLREYGIPRSEVFICSKVWPNFYHPDAVELCCDKILQGMQIDHLDCLLLHWPVAFQPTSLAALDSASAADQASMTQKGMKVSGANDTPVIDWGHTSEPIARAAGHKGSILPTWTAMQSLVHAGKTRAVGVSNFDVADLTALLPHSTDVPISLNQVEVHPWFPNTELIKFSNAHGIVTSCFSPFAGQKADGKTLVHDPTVRKLAEKNDMGVGQLLQSWAVQRGTVPLGKSGSEERIKANFAIRRLSDEDQKALDDLEIPGGKGRTIDFTESWGVKLWQK